MTIFVALKNISLHEHVVKSKALSDMTSVFKKSKFEHRQKEDYMNIQGVQSQRTLQYISQTSGSGIIEEQGQRRSQEQKEQVVG